MKKKSFLVLIILYCLSLAGCVQNTVNDPSTGEIVLSEKKYSYTDGTYIAYSAYYDNNGYAPVMQLVVSGGIVDSVRFDYFRADGSRYSQNTAESLAEEVSVFKSEVKSLNSTLLQSQTYTDLNALSDTDLNDVYTKFAETLFAKLLSGDTSPAGIVLGQVYSAAAEKNAYGYAPTLIVTYENNEITAVSFSQISDLGENISDLKVYTDLYHTQNAITYAQALEYLNTVPTDKATLTKAISTGIDRTLLNAYNRLAAQIAAKHHPFQSDPYSLFSSK